MAFKRIDAYMLSGEIATLLSGRYVEISMLPLSFREYVESIGDRREIGRKYAYYLQNSSFLYTLELRDNAKEIKTYLDAMILSPWTKRDADIIR